MAGQASRENGKKGGRPKGQATIEREKMKDYIAQKVAENGEAIVACLLAKALDNENPQQIAAVKELFDRGFGKPVQALAGDTDNPLTVVIRQYGGGATI